MKKFVLLGVIVAVAVAQIASITLHSNGIAGYNNSPNEITCTSCHITYPLNDTGGNVSIQIPTCLNNNYAVGQTYTVNVKTTRPGLYLFGFSLEALDSTGANAGTFTLINPGTTTLLNALVNSNNRTNVTHYGGVYGTDSCTFSFRWTAPATSVGKITFYAAANASNGDGYVDGDYIYTSSKTLYPDLATIIGKEKTVERLSIFPNPANDRVFIETTSHDILKIDLRTLSGEHVFSTNVKERSSISVAGLKDGIYLMTIMAGDRTNIKKIVVRH